MVVLLCPSLLTLLASILLSWVVQLVFWLCQEHLELFLLIWQEKRVVRKNLTCLDKTLTLQDLNTWEVRRRTFQHRDTSDRKGLFMYEFCCNEVCLFFTCLSSHSQTLSQFTLNIRFLVIKTFWTHSSSLICLVFFCSGKPPRDLNHTHAFPMTTEREPSTVSTSSFCSNVYCSGELLLSYFCLRDSLGLREICFVLLVNR